jgi:flagellar hook protein FlgE
MMSAVAGLRAQQTAMDVIGNNISNVNTAGFKASNTNFTDLFYQTLQQGNESVNPTQVGYGSRVGSVDKDMSSTGATNTDNPLDLYVDGEGFFAMNTKSDGSGTTYFSRLGNFHIDPSGFLVDSNGAYVESAKGSGTNTTVGTPICLMGSTFHSTTGQTIKIEGDTYKQLSNIQVNKDGTVNASLADQVGTLSLDTVNSTPIADTVFVPTAAGASIPSTDYQTGASPLLSVVIGNDGSVSATNAAGAGTIVKLTSLIGGMFVPTDITKGGDVQITSTNAADIAFTANADGTVNATYTNGAVTETGTLKDSDGNAFNLLGEIYQDAAVPPNPYTISAGNVGSFTYSLNSSGAVVADDGTNPPYTLLGKQMNIFGETFESSDGVSGQTIDATDYNSFSNITFNADGTITAAFNGDNGTIADVKPQDLKIALATFVNPNGLYESGNSYYTANISSGDPSYIGAGDGNSTVIRSGELEMSNVDLAKEFTNMIVTERGFQANSRVITVSDSMLEELVNLKRS